MNRFLSTNIFGKNLEKVILTQSTKSLKFNNLKKNESYLQLKRNYGFKNILCPITTQKHQINHLSKKITFKDKNAAKKEDLEDEDDTNDNDNEDSDDDDDDSFLKSIDTSDLPSGFKIIQKHVPSLRVDTVLASGLNMSRKKIDDNFYSSKLRLNGDKVLKKSFPIKESDRIDLISELDEKAGKRTLKRVYLYKILSETSKKNKPKVVLIVWKSGLYEEDAYKDIHINH